MYVTPTKKVQKGANGDLVHLAEPFFFGFKI